MSVAGYAPALADCARCGAPGPHRAFSVPAGGTVCPLCRPAGAASPSPVGARAHARPAHRRVGRRRGSPTTAPAARPAAWSPPTCSGTSSAGCAACRWWSAREAASRRRPRPRCARRHRTRPAPSRRRSRASSCRATSRSSWTATAAGPRTAACRAPPATRRGSRRCSTSSRARSSSACGWVSAYAFSTENWKRSPDEVRFLMGFNRDVIRRRRDEMHALGVRVRWAGRRPRLWRSVVRELEEAEELTKDNDVCTLTMCVNYGGRAEIADAARRSGARRRGRPARPGEGRRAGARALPRRAGHARRRPVPAHLRRAADVELPAVAVGVRRAGLPRHAVARRRPAPPVAGGRAVRRARPPLRRRGAERVGVDEIRRTRSRRDRTGADVRAARAGLGPRERGRDRHQPVAARSTSAWPRSTPRARSWPSAWRGSTRVLDAVDDPALREAAAAADGGAAAAAGRGLPRRASTAS